MTASDRTPKPAPSARDARLKAALKANMARRKAQARKRSGQDGDTSDTGDQTGQDKD
jgi:hypothetical protein